MEDFFEAKFTIDPDKWHSCHLCKDAIPPGMGYWKENDPEDNAGNKKVDVCRWCWRLRNEMVRMML